MASPDPILPADSGPDVAAAAERRWAWLVGAIVLFLLGMMAWMSLHWAAMPPLRTETVDAATLHLAGEFIEPNLGSVLEPDGSVTVRVVAHQYSFTPPCILVPAATPVQIRATAADVVHGFSIGASNVNLMLIPGYVTHFRTRFARPGEHLMPCHEYCGTGHAAMWAHVRVVERAAFMRRALAGRRVGCVE